MLTATSTAQPTQRPSLRHLVSHRPLLAYLVIAFVAVWIPLLPVVLASNGLGLLPITISDVAFVILFIGGTILGPTVGAFVVTAATEGKAGVLALLRRYIQWRVGLRWYLLAIFGPLVVHVLAAAAFAGVAPLRDVAENWTLIVTMYPLALLGMVLFPALIEEPGWRGFALPRMQAAFGPLAGTLLLGFLHAIWHLPVYFLVSGPAAMGPFDLTHLVTNTIAIMAITVFWSWVVNNGNGSILIAILLHAASNATGQLLRSLVQHYPADFDMIMLVVNIGIALLLIVGTRGRLGYQGAPVPADPLARE